MMVWISTADGADFQGKVSGLVVSGNAVFFTIEGVSYAECAKNKRYIINAGTAYGRNLYLLIQDAYSANKEVVISSLGTCSLSPDDAEDIGNLTIADDKQDLF